MQYRCSMDGNDAGVARVLCRVTMQDFYAGVRCRGTMKGYDAGVPCKGYDTGVLHRGTMQG